MRGDFIAMRPRSLLAALAGALLSIVPALGSAQTFIGGSLGQFRADVACASSCDRSTKAFKLTAGHLIDQTVGVEGMYFQLGKTRLDVADAGFGPSQADYQARGFGVFGVAATYVTESFSVIGKVGVVYARTQRDDVGPTAPGSDGKPRRSTDLAWGVGIGYDLTKAVSARLEWERMWLRFVSDKSDIDLVTLALLYRF